MAKMFAHIENQKQDKEKYDMFLPKIVDAMVYSTRKTKGKQNNFTDKKLEKLENLAEKIINLIPK